MNIDSIFLFAGNEITDLGINFDRELNFYIRSDKIYCKSLKTLGFIWRIFSEFTLVTSIKFIYYSILLRSILGYVWDPDTSCGMKVS